MKPPSGLESWAAVSRVEADAFASLSAFCVHLCWGGETQALTNLYLTLSKRMFFKQLWALPLPRGLLATSPRGQREQRQCARLCTARECNGNSLLGV